MPFNPILEEIWATRERILREHDFDIDKVWDTIFEIQKTSGRTYLKLTHRHNKKSAESRKEKATASPRSSKESDKRST